MATKIRGITVEIGGDTSGLEKSLKNVNTEVSSTSKQLKDVEKLLKLDPTNTELLAQKQKLLSEKVEATKDKLETLKQTEQQLKDAGVDENSEQFMALRREIISTEESLEAAEQEASNFNATCTKISTSMSKVSSAAATAAEKTRGLSTAAAGLITGLVGAGVSAAASADDLNTLAKQTGMSTETLQKMQYATDLIDVSYDTFTGSMSKMVTKLRTNEEGFNELGIATRDAAGNMLDNETVYWNAIEALSQIDNELEQDTAAQEIFGKSAADLAGIIDDNGAAFKELGDQAEAAGLIMSQETLDDLNAVNDQLDTLKATASATLAKTGATALETLTPVIEKVVAALGSLLEKISNMDASTIETILRIAAVVACVSPLLSVISKVTGFIGNLVLILPKLKTALGVVKGAFSALSSTMLANPIALVVAAIAALVAAFIYLWNNCEGFKEFWVNLWESLKEKVSTAIENIKEFFQGIIDWVSENWQALLLLIVAPFAGAFQLLYDNCDAFREKVDNTVEAVKQFFTNMKERAVEIFTNMKTAITEKVNTIKTNIVNGFNSAVEFIKTLPQKALQWGKDLIANFIAGVKAKIQALKDAVSNIAQTVKDFLGFSEPKKGPLSKFHTFAPDMMKLFASGIKDTSFVVENALGSAASNIGTTTAIDYSGQLGQLISGVNSLGGQSSGVYLDGKSLVGYLTNDIDRALGTKCVGVARGYA